MSSPPSDASERNEVNGVAPPAIELRGIDKRFGEVHANRDVSLAVHRGTIHGIVGENGRASCRERVSSVV